MIRKSNGQPQPQSGASTTSNASSARSFFWGLWVYYRPKNAKDLPECLEQAKNPGDVKYCVNKHTPSGRVTSPLTPRKQLRDPSESELKSESEAKSKFKSKLQADLEAKSKADLEAKLRSEVESKLRSELEAKSKAQLEEKTDLEKKTDIAEKSDLESQSKEDSESETEGGADAFGRSSSPIPFTNYYSDYHSPSIGGPGSYQLFNNNLSGQVYDEHCGYPLHGKE